LFEKDKKEALKEGDPPQRGRERIQVGGFLHLQTTQSDNEPINAAP